MDNFSQFSADMNEAGYEVSDYAGRNYYNGPSVRIEADELQSVIRATEVRLTWDTMGKTGLVVHPSSK